MDHMALQGAGEKCASRMLNCFTYLTHECMHQLVRATKTDSEASYSPITAQVMDCHLSTCKVRMKGSSSYSFGEGGLLALECSDYYRS